MVRLSVCALQHIDEVATRFCLRGMNIGIDEALRYLLVEFVTVGDDNDTRMGDILQNPLGEPNHSKRLAATLGMPDDAVLLVTAALFAGVQSEVLVGACHFLDSAIEDDTVVDELEQSSMVEHLQEGTVEQIVEPVGRIRRGVWGRFGGGERIMFAGRLFPTEIELFRGMRSAVIDAFALVAGEKELGGSEELRYLSIRLIAYLLSYAIVCADRCLLEFDNADGDAIDIDHDIGSAMFGGRGVADDGNLFGYMEEVVFRVAPIDERDGTIGSPSSLADGSRLGEQLVDIFVGVVERLVVMAGSHRIAQFFCYLFGLLRRAALFLGEELLEDRLYIGQVLGVVEVAVIGVATKIAQRTDDTVLRIPLGVGCRLHIRHDFKGTSIYSRLVIHYSNFGC